MPGSTNPVIRAKNKAYLSNSNGRSHSLKKGKDEKLSIGYFTLGIILFVVVGSAVFEILKFI
ncbi:putative stress-associated endoplasmic reticulum protein [Glomus cerebriforme]|uniref:Stress-associated endoplasmic reticulum protein n=1 Tax=Glomus cerebriforme TaxID=658196 RepID=A0A397SBZ1_9GLOM|nr:putative stress-associated endoplasmic reticulum protein [Glomus cerebriforme]